MIDQPFDSTDEEKRYKDERHLALSYVADAFEEARLDGIDNEALTQAALFFALKELVSTYGEEAVAVFTARLPTRVRNGEFSVRITRQ